MSEGSTANGNTITVGIVASHSVLRYALKHAIESHEGFEVIAEADCQDKVVELLRTRKPSVLLVHPDAHDIIGSKTVAHAKSTMPDINVVVLGIPGKTVEAADATIPQNAEWARFLSSLSSKNGAVAIQDNGQILASNGTALRRTGRRRSIEPGTPESLSALSAREREVFYLLANGVPNRLIAKQLFVSPRTIETHRARVIRKLGLNSTASIVRYAIRHNLLSA